MKKSLALLAIGLATIWIVGYMAAHAICTAAGNGVCLS